MQLDFVARELTIKLVYYGPALSGKTTNLQVLHELSTDETRGRLMTLETRDDRTLFFDLLPLTFKSDRDFSVRLKLYTVPGQVIHASTRKLVLQGADGVAFIADSQPSETRNNAAAFKDLKENLKEQGIELGKMPLVIQFNKQDLPTARPEAEIIAQAQRGKEPVFCASAVQHRGVVETFVGLLFVTWQSLDGTHGLSARMGLDRDRFFGEITGRFRGKRPLIELLRSAHTAAGRELSKEIAL
jgi:signal recognition particle receptor subunit beta